jgi:preprotein translocase subunit YajC
MFITPAFADTAANAAAAAPDASAGLAGLAANYSQFIPIVLVIVVFYFMIILPQSKRAQQHRDMVGGLEKGDKVITGGGLVATVKKIVDDKEVVLELSEGVQVTALRSTIVSKRA